MPTYIYETIPGAGKASKLRRFEVKQSIHDAPLRYDPETGEPVRRVIAGGVSILSSSKSSAPASMPSSGGGGCCGGGACGCH